MYNGIRFRSRIEAKWACLFDLMRWSWVYEPADLDWYIPDFLVRLGDRQIVVEIKGADDLTELRSHAHKIVSSGWRREFLILGSVIHTDNVVGIIGDDHDFSAAGQCELDAARIFRCLNCGKLSVHSQSLSWRCRCCHAADGNAHVGDPNFASLEPGFAALWAEATNRVQWRPDT
jgi:hypothetical protein